MARFCSLLHWSNSIEVFEPEPQSHYSPVVPFGKAGMVSRIGLWSSVFTLLCVICPILCNQWEPDPTCLTYTSVNEPDLVPFPVFPVKKRTA